MNPTKSDITLMLQSNTQYPEHLLYVVESALELLGLDPDTVEDLTNCVFKEHLRSQEEDDECYVV